MAKYWPVVFLYNKFLYFFNVKIACKWIIIILANELYLNNFQNLKKAPVVQDIFNILLILD